MNTDKPIVQLFVGQYTKSWLIVMGIADGMSAKPTAT
jgi:hypothetical protein